MTDPHNREAKLQANKANLMDTNLSDHNKQLLDDWYTHLTSQGLSIDRISRLLSSMSTLSQYIDFPLDNPDKKRLKKLVGRINQGRIERQDNRDKDYSPWTLAEFKKAIKSLYQYITEDDDPEIVDFLTVTVSERDKQRTDPSTLLRPKHIQQLARHATNPRDTALVMTLWDTGARISEVLNIKWEDITWDREIPSIHIRESKTMQRTVYIHDCADALREWRERQPGDSPGNQYVFTRLQARGDLSLDDQISYKAAHGACERAADKAGLDDRLQTTPHGYRKARATYLASQGWNAAQLMQQFGWTDFNRAKDYVRMAKRDLEDAVKQMHGFDTEEDDQDDKMEVLHCHGCDTVNGAHRSSCKGCGVSLTGERDRFMDGVQEDLTEQVHDTLVDKLLDGEINRDDLEDEARKVAEEHVRAEFG